MSSQFLRNGRFISFSAFRWIHRARLNLHLLNGNNKRAADSRCKTVWSTGNLTTRLEPLQASHALDNTTPQCCPKSLVNAIPKRSEQMVYVNQRIPGICSARRPDIVVMKPDSKEVVIIDVTVPFENGPHALADAAQRKIEKLSPKSGNCKQLATKLKPLHL
ncbi:hypothetical protein L596_025974 [Steinernema carpocapsae]|uniref:Uncharacterized protein n=1 Tax=Steinernema carpocapsae TaxID=34508 RepID=A0A4U5M9B2_STECR|nr:hypothetical protein L596_025974 [Steinernema carpocapsae]